MFFGFGPHQDRRGFPRQRFDQIATFSVGGMVYPCRIAGISVASA